MTMASAPSWLHTTLFYGSDLNYTLGLFRPEADALAGPSGLREGVLLTGASPELSAVLSIFVE